MAKTFTRQQLHDLVWSAPMREVSKGLGISDVGLRKNCVKAFVPPPPQGHWNRVKAGHAVKVAPLPPRPPGISDEITIGHDNYYNRDWKVQLLANEPVPPVFPEAIETLRERVAKNIGTVLASKNLATPHIAFRREVEDDARRKAMGSAWDPPILQSAFEKRRLKILQGLFFGLARLDCRAEVQGKDLRIIFVTVGHRQVRITLDRLPARRQRPGSTDVVDVERMKFVILRGNHDDVERLSWVDDGDDLIEGHLSEIATEIVVSGELQYREHLLWLYDAHVKQRREFQEEEVRKKLAQEKAERERLLKLEADRLKRLRDSAEDYRRANDIRSFVASVILSQGEKASGERIQRWQEWALMQADKLDPIVTGRIWDTVNEP